MLEITVRKVDSVNVLDMKGHLTLGEGTSCFHDTVVDLIRKGDKKIIANMGEVTYVDNSGIGEMVSMWSRANEHGGRLTLLNPKKRLTDLLQITKLYTVFEIHDSEDVAVKSFE